MKRKKTYAETYFKAYVFLLILTCLLLPFYEKGKFEIAVNKQHAFFFDVFFAGITHLGDGVIIILPIIAFFFVKYSYVIFLTWSTLIHAIVVILGKRVLFRGMPRPIKYLEGLQVYTVPGVPVNLWNTFPSGHTTTIFMMTCALAMLSHKKRWFQLVLLCIAIVVGFSRIYLMQHFLPDVLAGSVLGVASAYGGRWLTIKFFSKKKFRKSLYPKRIKTGNEPVPS